MRAILSVHFVVSLHLAIGGLAAQAAEPANSGFEKGTEGWRPLWTRQPGVGTLTEDHETVHGGHTALRLEHRGAEDWSLEPLLRMPVTPGDVFVLEGWIRFAEGPGSATLCVSTWDAQGQVRDWAFGGRETSEAGDWRLFHTRFVVPAGITAVHPRLIGHGPSRLWLDDVSWSNEGSVRNLRSADLPSDCTVSNEFLQVALHTADGTLRVRDLRNGTTWEQVALNHDLILRNARPVADGLDLELLNLASELAITARLRLEKKAPELTVELRAQGGLPAPIRFPHPFTTTSGQHLVVPMNEGISYPVEDATIEPMHLVAYGGHGICMSFWGVTGPKGSHLAILETPDDASILMRREQGHLLIEPWWEPQRGQFGYDRRVRYVFFDQGDHVAMAKRYRAYAQSVGLVKTLEEKRRANPQVDLLIGAANIWCWERDAVGLAKQMQSAGIQRILWSQAQRPESLRELNSLGVLTSRYDVYQDVMDPANFPQLGYVHPDWVTQAWPDDVIRNRSGQWIHGWGVQGTNGAWFDCGVICDQRALPYARLRIPAELKTHPYRCRFIDTTTAAPWHECYATNHPMTRTDSRRMKMELLGYISNDLKLVTGSETGHEAAVPYVHYFEGMLSLGPYRVPDAGRDMARLWTNAPEAVVKFQLGHRYRLPLWELVYHDCVVAQWYWGDYNNKLPALWDKRDLFNVLYGTPPMFMFNRAQWQTNQARFVRSYLNTSPWVREAGYSEMTAHRFLRADRDVQQTEFANGLRVTVNFGDAPFTLPDGAMVPPMGFVAGRVKAER